jgi:hypothetical protein
MSFHSNTFGNNRNVPKIDVNKLINFKNMSDEDLIKLIKHFIYGDKTKSMRLLNEKFDRTDLIKLLTDTLIEKQENLESIKYSAPTKKNKIAPQFTNIVELFGSSQSNLFKVKKKIEDNDIDIFEYVALTLGDKNQDIIDYTIYTILNSNPSPIDSPDFNPTRQEKKIQKIEKQASNVVESPIYKILTDKKEAKKYFGDENVDIDNDNRSFYGNIKATRNNFNFEFGFDTLELNDINNIKPTDGLIFVVVSNIPHTILYIAIAGKYYTLGFGVSDMPFSEEEDILSSIIPSKIGEPIKNKKAAIYSPDHLAMPGHDNAVVWVDFLNTDIINRLIDCVTKIDSLEVSYTFNNNEINFKKINWNLDSSVIYNECSSTIINGFFPNNNNAKNCLTFVEYIIGRQLACYRGDPKECKKVTEKDMDIIIDLYLKGNEIYQLKKVIKRIQKGLEPNFFYNILRNRQENKRKREVEEVEEVEENGGKKQKKTHKKNKKKHTKKQKKHTKKNKKKQKKTHKKHTKKTDQRSSKAT